MKNYLLDSWKHRIILVRMFDLHMFFVWLNKHIEKEKLGWTGWNFSFLGFGITLFIIQTRWRWMALEFKVGNFDFPSFVRFLFLLNARFSFPPPEMNLGRFSSCKHNGSAKRLIWFHLDLHLNFKYWVVGWKM